MKQHFKTSMQKQVVAGTFMCISSIKTSSMRHGLVPHTIGHEAKTSRFFIVLILLIGTAPAVRSGLGAATWVYMAANFQNTNKSDPMYFDLSVANYANVTHAIYSAAEFFPPNYSLTYTLGYESEFFALRSKWPKLKLLVSIIMGSDNPEDGIAFATFVGSSANRAKLVASVVHEVKKYNMDGVDFDWEATTASQTNNLVALITELRAGLDSLNSSRHLLLTAAVQIERGSSGYALPRMVRMIDTFHLLAYEMHDPCWGDDMTAFHTDWTDIKSAIDIFLAQGIPPAQMTLGISLYGHTYTLLDASRFAYPAPNVLCNNIELARRPIYRTIMAEKSAQGGSIFVDQKERCAYYVHGTDWVSFDTVESIWLKMQGSAGYNLSGMMIWHGAMDFPNNSVLQFVASRRAPPPRPCGNGYIGIGICVDKSQCCGSRGYCGLGVDTCGAGCVNGPCALEPPSPPPYVVCGQGVVGSRVCDDGTCCTFEGYCGSDAASCGSGCVGGPCLPSPPSLPSGPSPPHPPQPKPPRPPPSPKPIPKPIKRRPPPPRRSPKTKT